MEIILKSNPMDLLSFKTMPNPLKKWVDLVAICILLQKICFIITVLISFQKYNAMVEMEYKLDMELLEV
jgi:hypothetical protein